MVLDIIKIAGLCVIVGSASIPLSFGVNSSPVIVWLGNVLGCLFSATIIIYIGQNITSQKFKQRASRNRIGKKVVGIFDQGDSNKSVAKAGHFINDHGLRFFSFISPLFPGVLIGTAAVYLLNLSKRTYISWMIGGTFFVSGAYVFSYWWFFIR